MEIRLCNSTDLLQLRQTILRPNQAIDSVMFAEDNLEDTIHLAVFDNETVVSCLTAFPKNLAPFDYKLSYQLRGLATDENFRKRGFATALINTMLDTLQFKGSNFAWFNARCTVVDFYKKLGFVTSGEKFQIPNTVEHIKMYKILKDN